MNAEPLTPAKIARTLEEEKIDLPDKHFAALVLYLNGATKSSACATVGLPEQNVWSIFAGRKMQRAMAAVVERFLSVDATPAAFRVLYMLMNDEKQAGGTRLGAAAKLLAIAGYAEKRYDPKAKEGKELTEMSADELRAEIARLEQEQDSRMKDVTGNAEPVSEPDNSYLSDFP